VIAPASSFVSTITIQDDARLVALQGQPCSRLARLLRKERQLYQACQEDELQQAIYDALDILSEMWGVDLDPASHPWRGKRPCHPSVILADPRQGASRSQPSAVRGQNKSRP
jgi:hypothetical protein